MPKLGFLENSAEGDLVASCDPRVTELSFFWSGRVPHQSLNNGYMGPSLQAVKQHFYSEFKASDDIDHKYNIKIENGKVVGIDNSDNSIATLRSLPMD